MVAEAAAEAAAEAVAEAEAWAAEAEEAEGPRRAAAVAAAPRGRTHQQPVVVVVDAADEALEMLAEAQAVMLECGGRFWVGPRNRARSVALRLIESRESRARRERGRHTTPQTTRKIGCARVRAWESSDGMSNVNCTSKV